MLVLLCVCAGVALWWLVSGRMPRVASLELRHGALVFTALVLQTLIFTPAASAVPTALVVPIHLGSYALMGAFLVLNWRRIELLILTAGFAANALAIALNDGRMPVSLDAWTATGRPAAEITATGAYNNNVLAGPNTHLAWLGDVFALPRQVPFANALSVGDVLIITGALLLLILAGQRARFRPATLLAPLGLPSFRRVMVARCASQIGDWITLAATVTWIYSRTHSTVWLSAFMIVRIGAVTLGGLVAAPRLGRTTTRMVSALGLARGALTVVALLLAWHGDVLPTLAVLALSASLSSPAAATTSALIPVVVDSTRRHAANALVAFAGELALVTGTALASLLAAHWDFAVALGIDAATFAVSAAIYLALPSTTSERSRSATAGRRDRRRLRSLVKAPTVAFLLASFSVTTAGIGLLNSSLPRLFAQATANAHAYGYAMAAIGAGALAGGLLAGTTGRESVIRRLLPFSFASMAVALAVIAQSRVEATILLLLFLLGAADATTEVSYSTLLQRHVPSDRLASVLSLGSAGVNAGMIVGFAVAALLSRISPPSTAIDAAAAGCFAGALIAAAIALPNRGARATTTSAAARWPESLPRRLDLERLAYDDLVELAARCGVPAESESETTLRQQLAALRAAAT